MKIKALFSSTLLAGLLILVGLPKFALSSADPGNQLQANSVRGATELLSESFTDVTFPPAGWAVHNIDGESEEWSRIDTTFNTAPAAAMHTWNSTDAQEGWLVTPPVSITSGATATLSFFDGGQWMVDYGYSGVMLSSASCDPADGDFDELAEIDDTPGPTGTITWRETSIELDLSAYAGESVCVAFLYQGTDAHRWLIDDVLITEVEGLSYTVTAIVAAGQGSITPPSQDVASGADANLTVTPDPGWSLDDISADTCNPINNGGDQWLASNITADCAVEARFVINPTSIGATPVPILSPIGLLLLTLMMLLLGHHYTRRRQQA